MVFYVRIGGGLVFCQVIVDLIHDRVAKPYTYCIPDGMHLDAGQRVEVPFGSRKLEGIVLSLLSEAPDGLMPEKIREVIRPLDDYPAVPAELMELAVDMARETHCPLAEMLRLMIPAEMRKGRIRARTERQFRLAVSEEKALAFIDQDRRKGKRSLIIRMMLDGKERSLREIRETVPNPEDALRKLISEGIVSERMAEVLRSPGSETDTSDHHFTLTSGQKEALEEILPALHGNQGAFLLHGVTGSGKTEVFMAAVRETLSLGKGAIILVPEIALTPQMVSWFRAKFGASAAVIHSRLSAGERYDEWRRIRRGEARLVIGARSAVFSPVSHLGLIVVDEEHESTYISDHRPRYDARDVAEKRCHREGATLILASATPSILSFARARRGDFTLLEMPERANHSPLPAVSLIDMRRELEEGNRSIFSRELKSAMRACIHHGEQMMLLMNRRGYHQFVSCRSCGTVIRCPHCDLSLTYHALPMGGRLKCHYCGYESLPPENCPSCGSRYIKFFGAGTQQVEDEVHKLFPGVRTVRMDYDTTSGKDGHQKALQPFRDGLAQVMIGTQMIAKGLDFPGVTLVGVIAADMTLNLPDYRSRERTFQLLTQVAGRAGRGQKSGRVIVQTYRPEDETLTYAARQDFRGFFEAEFLRRRHGLYPPFTVLSRVLIESEKDEIAEQAAEYLESEIRGLLLQHAEWQKKLLLINRSVPSVALLRGKNRRQILMKLLQGTESDEFIGAVTDLLEQTETRAEVRLEVNPVNMI